MKQRLVLSSATQHWGTGMSEWERSVLTLGPQVPNAYPAMCEIQRDLKIMNIQIIVVLIKYHRQNDNHREEIT